MVTDYSNIYFSENRDGKFDTSVLNGILTGVDKCLNPCIVKDGVVRRSYSKGGVLPSYAIQSHPSVKPRVGCFEFDTNNERNYLGVYLWNKNGNYEQMGKIDLNGKYHGKKVHLSDHITDSYCCDMIIDYNGNIVGHEGVIHTFNGYRLAVNKFNRVDIVQTKLYLLFDYLAKRVAVDCADDFLGEYVFPYVEEVDQINELFVKGLDGLEINFHYDKENLRSATAYGMTITIDEVTIAEFELNIFGGIGHVKGWIQVGNKYMDVSDIKDTYDLDKTIDKILSKASKMEIDPVKLFKSEMNDFGYDSLEKLQNRRRRK